jgi:hypothetical protein
MDSKICFIEKLVSIRTTGDCEIDEFSAVNEALIKYPDNRVYTLLKKLESKFFKYAQVDYDRETSLFTIRILLSYLSEVEVQIVFKELESFIKTNEEKIQRIFKENKDRYFEIPFLTQPEIFLIWFSLEKFSYSMTDNWVDYFDSDELEQITTLWGKIID